jgi:hypothetical protein
MEVVDQHLLEPLGVFKIVDTTTSILEISIHVDFKAINLAEM